MYMYIYIYLFIYFSQKWCVWGELQVEQPGHFQTVIFKSGWADPSMASEVITVPLFPHSLTILKNAEGRWAFMLQCMGLFGQLSHSLQLSALFLVKGSQDWTACIERVYVKA